MKCKICKTKMEEYIINNGIQILFECRVCGHKRKKLNSNKFDIKQPEPEQTFFSKIKELFERL